MQTDPCISGVQVCRTHYFVSKPKARTLRPSSATIFRLASQDYFVYRKVFRWIVFS